MCAYSQQVSAFQFYQNKKQDLAIAIHSYVTVKNHNRVHV